MLSHRPWTCTDLNDRPPTCDTELLQDFKTMVIRFLSHAEWRHAVYGERKPPQPKDWLMEYWNTFLEHLTKNDRGPSYGPLWTYFQYNSIAEECLTTSAKLDPPHQNVKQWKYWEEMLRWNYEQVFWNPYELLSD